MWFSKVTRKEFAIVSMGSLDFSFVFLISCRKMMVGISPYSLPGISAYVSDCFESTSFS